MGKVNWQEAQLKYVSDSRVSYNTLALEYGVSKPTVQAYGTKHQWPTLRKEYTKFISDAMLKKAKSSLADMELRHLRIYQHMQAISFRELNRLQRLSKEGKFKPSHVDQTYKLIKVMEFGINGERLILGISYKPVRHPLDDGSPPTTKYVPERPVTFDIDKEIKDAKHHLGYLLKIKNRTNK